MTDLTEAQELFADVGELNNHLDVVLTTRAEVEAVQKSLNAANDRRKAAEARLLDLMHAAGLKSFKARVAVTAVERTFYRVNKADQNQCVSWLDEIGAGEIAQRAVPWQTLDSFCRTKAEDGDELPGFVGTHTETRLQIRK